MDLTGCRLLVVGASSGVGRATAIVAAEAGAHVAVSARRADAVHATAVECGRDTVALTSDVSHEDSCHELVEQSTARLGGLDAIVYAAGVSRIALVADTPGAEWARIFATNVTGFGLVFAAAQDQLVANRGQMVSISSAAAARPKHGLVPYSASKRALETLVQGLRDEQPAVSFTVVSIGPTSPTEFGRDFDRTVAAELKPRWVASGMLAEGAMSIDDVGVRIVQCLAAPMRTEYLDLLPKPTAGVDAET